jgi:hypothetical protein
VLSKRFRQLIATSHFWLRHRRLGAPPDLPHVARLYRHEDGKACEFHVAGPAFAMMHTVDTDRCWYASTCDGLVLVSSLSYGKSSVEGVVFNPATREEARLSLPLPYDKGVGRIIIGFGYAPSSKVYKALIRELHNDGDRLMVVPLDGQEPRIVFSSDHQDLLCRHTLHMGDGKLYFLIYTVYFTGEEGYQEDIWETTSVLAFDFDDEVATTIALPEGHDISEYMMLEVRGRPCIYKQKCHDTLIWLLTPDHRWEQLCILVKEGSSPSQGDYFAGAWDCGGGLLLAVFKLSGAYLYNLHEAAAEVQESGSKRLAALSSLAIEYEWPEQFKNGVWFGEPRNLLDYRPTLISPASIVGDAAYLSRRPPRERVVGKHELDELFLDMTRTWVLGPAMQMLAKLEEEAEPGCEHRERGSEA